MPHVETSFRVEEISHSCAFQSPAGEIVSVLLMSADVEDPDDDDVIGSIKLEFSDPEKAKMLILGKSFIVHFIPVELPCVTQ